MRQVRTPGVLVSASLLGLWLAAVTVPLSAQQPASIDRGAVHKTHVPSLDTRISTGGAGPTGAPQAGSPSTFAGTPYSAGPTVTPTTTFPEAEEYIAADPNNSSNLIAVVSDFALRGGYNTTKYVVSTSNGTFWVENYVPITPSGLPVTADGNIWYANSDPAVAIDKAGYVFLSNLYLINASYPIFNNNANGLYVSVATFNPGVSFNLNFSNTATFPVVAANPDPSTPVTEDKPWIAVDNSSSPYAGTVYVSWTHFANGSNAIYLSRSTNHGVTWSSVPIKINPDWANGAVQGSQVAVGPNGEVYVVYEVFFVGGKRQHFLAKSTDGGQSFTTPVAISSMFNELNFNSTYRKNSFASLGASPINGNVYVVYADQPNGSVGAEVEFVASTNGGTSFSTPVAINNPSKGQQFMPALTVDSSGVIHVSWFDTRNSPNNPAFYDIYATRSLSSGAKFSSNARVTTNPINAGTATFIGDYAGVTAGGGFVHPVWTNGGFNNGFLQTGALQ